MKRLIRLLTLSVPLVLTSCGSGLDSEAVPDPTLQELSSTRYQREVCEVYAAVITDRYPSKTYVIQTDPAVFPCGGNDSKGKAGFPSPFDGTGHYVLASDAELRSLFKKGEDGWTNFAKRYPDANGIIELGPIEINRDRTQAVISASRSCGLKCGSGNRFTLHKKNGTWFVFSSDGGWVS